MSECIVVKNGIRLLALGDGSYRILGVAEPVRVSKAFKPVIVDSAKIVITAQPAALVRQFAASPPRLGEFLVCIFVPPDRQVDRLGDFEEKFNTLWLPRFGARVARIVYITHAVRSAVFRLAAVTTVLARIMGFHW